MASDPAAELVEGVYMDRSLQEFWRACVVAIEAEQRKAHPDRGALALLEDAVRVGRELAQRDGGRGTTDVSRHNEGGHISPD